MANPLGNAAIVETSDKKILVLQRSHNVGEFPGYYVFPGGHSEVTLTFTERSCHWIKHLLSWTITMWIYFQTKRWQRNLGGVWIWSNWILSFGWDQLLVRNVRLGHFQICFSQVSVFSVGSFSSSDCWVLLSFEFTTVSFQFWFLFFPLFK